MFKKCRGFEASGIFAFGETGLGRKRQKQSSCGGGVTNNYFLQIKNALLIIIRMISICFPELIDIVEAESGYLDRADEAENAVIDNLRELGNELLKDWGAYKENQKFEEVCDLHPEAVSKKKHILDEHLECRDKSARC